MASSKRTPEALARKNAAFRLKYQSDPEFRAQYCARSNESRRQRKTECAECHRLRPLVGHGLCGTCYGRRKRLLFRDKCLAYEQKYRDKNRERERVRLRRYYAKTKVKQMVRAAKWRAGLTGTPFDLTEHDVQIPLFCPVLGMPIEQSSGRQKPNSPSLDRIVPERGYVKGNVRVISSRANTLKRDGTLDEFRAIVAYMERQ